MEGNYNIHQDTAHNGDQRQGSSDYTHIKSVKDSQSSHFAEWDGISISQVKKESECSVEFSELSSEISSSIELDTAKEEYGTGTSILGIYEEPGDASIKRADQDTTNKGDCSPESSRRDDICSRQVNTTNKQCKKEYGANLIDYDGKSASRDMNVDVGTKDVSETGSVAEIKKEPETESTPSVKSSKNNYKCDVCFKTFTKIAYLDIHKKAHGSGNKKASIAKCDDCGKTFSRSFNLLRHARSHNGEKPYECGVCHKTFTRTSHLQEHMRLHTGERPFKCGECDETFTTANSLTMHRRKHSGERPYRCDVCSKTFTSRSHLQAHIRIHSGEKPYECGVCQKAFNQGSQLQQHMMTHTKDKPYKCDVCGKTFGRNTYLQNHIGKHFRTQPNYVIRE